MKFVLALIALAFAALANAAPQLQAREQKPIAIVKLASDVSPDGSFTYEYETENQIRAEARGILNNAGNPETEALSVQGSFSFVSDNGETYTVTYIADENGFQPQGAHLPVPPPIPEAIQRSLDFNAKNPEPEEQPRQQYRQ